MFLTRAALAAVAASLLAVACPVPAAETVFRCGNNNYSQVPCAQGQAIDVDDSRSDAQRAAARDVAAREARLAAQMASDRERAEAAAALASTQRVRTKANVGGVAPNVTPPKRNRQKSRRSVDGVDFVAVGPRPAKK